MTRLNSIVILDNCHQWQVIDNSLITFSSQSELVRMRLHIIESKNIVALHHLAELYPTFSTRQYPFE